MEIREINFITQFWLNFAKNSTKPQKTLKRARLGIKSRGRVACPYTKFSRISSHINFFFSSLQLFQPKILFSSQILLHKSSHETNYVNFCILFGSLQWYASTLTSPSLQISNQVNTLNPQFRHDAARSSADSYVRGVYFMLMSRLDFLFGDLLNRSCLVSYCTGNLELGQLLYVFVYCLFNLFDLICSILYWFFVCGSFVLFEILNDI